MFKAYFKLWKNYFNFKDRTTRKDYWTCVIFNLIIGIIFLVVGKLTGEKGIAICAMLSLIYLVLIMIPMLSMTIRRLHDVDKPTKYILFGLIPVVGMFMILYAEVSPSIECNRGIQL